MPTRLSVKKTYKLYLGGKFPRSESGRVLAVKDAKGAVVANYAHASKKDFRNAVVAARSAFSGWSGATPYLRSQILYRMAEMLDGRADSFIAEMSLQGLRKNSAQKELDLAIECLVHYAGWCDKYQQVFSSANPVASPHFNFSVLEPTGVVAVFAPSSGPLSGLVGALAPVIAGGNVAIVIPAEAFPLSALSFGEVLATSDLPGGVVNLLTSPHAELVEVAGSHLDVNAVVAYEASDEARTILQQAGATSIKRLSFHEAVALPGDPYRITELQEVKTIWHPVGL
jgi:acyl-CoA reductase-like NAD-dependent aldehyde dehydrogenase